MQLKSQLERKLGAAGHSGQQQHNQCGKGLDLGAKSGVGDILKWISGRWLAALKALVMQQKNRSGIWRGKGAKNNPWGSIGHTESVLVLLVLVLREGAHALREHGRFHGRCGVSGGGAS
jgi:hypothetical protein